jgi:uncharacterized protein
MKVRVSDIRASGDSGLEVRFAPGPEWYAQALEGADVDTSAGTISGELILTWPTGTEGTILSTGRVDATLAARCVRCLERVGQSHALDMRMVLLPKGAESTRPARANEKDEADEPAADNDEEVSYYSGEWVDVGELVREALLLSLPAYPLCREDCRGLCARCGADLNQGACSCPPERESPFAALAGLKDALERK